MCKKILILFVVSLILSFIGCKCNCDDDMSQKRQEYGEPEEINTYDSSDYHSVTWWYWSQGISFTFTWGTNVSGCCEVSTFTFSPISADSSQELKMRIMKSLKLKNLKSDFYLK